MKKNCISYSAAIIAAISAHTASATELPVEVPSSVHVSSMASTPAGYGEFSRNTNQLYNSVKDVNTAGRFNDLVRFLADQLNQNRDIKNIGNSHIAVASIVALDDISRTNKLGYLLQEHLLHELQVRGYKVVDYKLMNDQLQVTKDGDFVFSRDPKRLKKNYDIAHVISGTYSFQAEGIVLNLRAVDTKTGVITSSAQAYLPRNDYEFIMTGKEGTYYNGEYYYRESNQVRVIERPVAYSPDRNTVNIVK